ncbi:MAG: hypothetical protein HO274_09920 [Ferrovum myxofaciens]|uniref:hypothetical protein n=1 Tax=Ferrovum myxofaciens TaxID=416213 RepID=UPI002352E418|nr:hypothetical protein [Ferrovum myxofaciens]QKE41596.1 MAG: hypothetical protein HO274_09920 [Ferrovum myxofaciens]
METKRSRRIRHSQMQPVGFLDLGTLPAPEPQPRTGILELKLDLGGGVVLTLTRN